MINVNFTPQFLKDIKRLQRKHYDVNKIKSIVELVRQDTTGSKNILLQRHNMHILKGSWKGAYECHVVKVGDWIVIWRRSKSLAVFERSGTHDELFRSR